MYDFMNYHIIFFLNSSYGHGLRINFVRWHEKNYSLRPTFFALFEKSNFLKEHHLLSCLPFKNV